MIAKYYLIYRSILGKGTMNWKITWKYHTDNRKKKLSNRNNSNCSLKNQYVVLVKNNTQDWRDFQIQWISTVQGGKVLGLYSLERKKHNKESETWQIKIK